MHDLIGVACAPHAGKQLDSLLAYWKNMSDDAIPEYSIERAKPVSGGFKIPFKEATQIMFDQLSIKKRLEYGGQ